MPSNCAMAFFCFDPTSTVEAFPPSAHASSRASRNFASERAPVVKPSVGAATVPEEKPTVDADAVDVARTPFPLLSVVGIHDSIDASERAVPEPPAEDAWLRTMAYSMSFFSSRIFFLSCRLTSDLRPALATRSWVREIRKSLRLIWQ